MFIEKESIQLVKNDILKIILINTMRGFSL